jgi:alpha-tubulin suppressor-like RCC1 family protein
MSHDGNRHAKLKESEGKCRNESMEKNPFSSTTLQCRESASLSEPHAVLSLVLLGVLTGTLLLATGCTKRSDVAYVNIELPKGISADSQKTWAPGEARSISSPVAVLSEDEGPEWNSSLNPTTGSEINCFAIFVGGPNLSGNYCRVTDNSNMRRIDFGPNRGFLPAGSIVQMEVPAGPDRVFHVVGLRAASASACSSYQNSKVDDENLSEPFLIASQRANIPSGESSLSIVAALDANKKIKDCSFVGSGGSGGLQINFGDTRDGRLTYDSPSQSAYLDTEMDNLGISQTGYTHTPRSGGSTSSKTASATRQISSVATSGANAGRLINVSSNFSSNDFGVGDEVMWYVSGGRANPGPPDHPVHGACGGDFFLGRYGFAKIAAVPTDGSILLDRTITSTPVQVKNANLTAPTTNTHFCRVSIQRVMQFDEIEVGANSTLNILGSTYNHTTGTGGILPIRVRKLNIDGTLNLGASAYGYRGANGTTFSGGSLYGDSVAANGFPNGNGGASSQSVNSGGGGAGAGEGASNSQAAGSQGGQPLKHGQPFAVSDISIGSSHGCAIASGKALCWGEALTGELGIGTSSADTPLIRFSPQAVLGAVTFTQISIGQRMSCGISQNGQVFCWGSGSTGAIGDGNTSDRYQPTPVSDTSPYLKIATSSTGGGHVCGIRATSKLVRCWGTNISGQLGDGTTTNRSVPTDISLAGVEIVDVSVGDSTSCALTSTGQVYCWGRNDDGQYGNNSTTNSSVPLLAAGGQTFKKIAVGKGFVCGIRTDDQISCWGSDSLGQLANGTGASDSLVPQIILGGHTYKDLAAGIIHACAIDLTGITRCWGGNYGGQLGDGTFTDRSVPIPILPNGSGGFVKITAGSSSTCGLQSDGQAFCWGDSQSGQLGSGTKGTSNLPNRVRQQRYDFPLLSKKAYLGGGGGGGLESGSSRIGGSGGGFVWLMANEVKGAGTLNINARGGDGQATSSATGQASGGGGGGIVAAAIRKLTINSANINVQGGSGAAGTSDSGGAGGGGFAELYKCSAESSTNATILVNGGSAPGRAFGERGLFIHENSAAICNSP